MGRRKKTADQHLIEWASLSSDSVMLALARYPQLYMVYRYLECQVGRPMPEYGLANGAIATKLGLASTTVSRYLTILQKLGLVTILTNDITGQRLIELDFSWSEETKGLLAAVARGDLELVGNTGILKWIRTPTLAPLSKANTPLSKGGEALENASKPLATSLLDSTSKLSGEPVDPTLGAVSGDFRPGRRRYLVLDRRIRALTSALSKDLVTRAREDSSSNRVLVGLNRPIVLVLGSESDYTLKKDLANDDIATISLIFDHWKTATGHQDHRLTKQIVEKVRARLKKFTPEQLLDVCERIAASEWHMGRNPQNKDYSDLPRNFRNDDKVQEWLTKPKLTGKADTRHLESARSDKPVTEERF